MKDCLGLDMRFMQIGGSGLAELPLQGVVKAMIEITGNCPMEIEGGDLVVYPGDGIYCLFDGGGCCLPMVRNLAFKWNDTGVTNPVKQARLTLYKQVDLNP